MKILLASNNQHKHREMQEIFNAIAPGKIEIILPKDILTEELDVIEDAPTLEGNAEKKAKEFFEKSGIPCIADDTGLEIDALDGRPGVYSARFAGEPANDQNNRAKVLEEMKNIPENERQARFRTVISYYSDAVVKNIDGICIGKILSEEKGDSGFGYDPIFIPDNYNLTFAEMSSEEKNSISHRYRASKSFAEWFLENISK